MIFPIWNFADLILRAFYLCTKSLDLFFVGEVLDVTGWLGGYNLHWAWSSGYCAGQYV